MEFKLQSEYPVPARRLFDMVRAPAFQEAMAFRFGALEVSVTEVEQRGSRIQMKIERTDPGRDLTGRISSSKTERSVVIHDWDLDRMESIWSRHLLDRGKMVALDGNVCIEVLGREASRLVETGTIAIKIPLIGRKLEQKVIDQLEEAHPRRVDFIMQQLGCEE